MDNPFKRATVMDVSLMIAPLSTPSSLDNDMCSAYSRRETRGRQTDLLPLISKVNKGSDRESATCQILVSSGDVRGPTHTRM